MQRDRSEELQRIYSCSPSDVARIQARYTRLEQFFDTVLPGPSPRMIVRAPGRVNLIGEHTDYNGYPVFPMAIDRDAAFVIAPRTDRTIELQNEDPAFGQRTFAAVLPVPSYQQGDWGNYVKAAVHTLLEARIVDPERCVGFSAAVGGTIPESAGLSSSSALVVASALAFLAVNGVSYDPRRLADLLARGERYVGSEGGGMDQAVSLLAEAGHALKIDFFPLRTESVPLPSDLALVICNSLVRAPKSEKARYGYNRRVVECRIAAGLLSKELKRKKGVALQAQRLADLSAITIGVDDAEMVTIARDAIGMEPMSLRDIAGRLGQSNGSVEQTFCALQDGSVLAEPADGFKVWSRYRHVVSEAERVNAAAVAFRNGDIRELGRLMNESHASCRDDYEISCRELEALVAVARKHGALGARLTGAGFGGCTVNAVPADRLDQFIQGVTAEYYHTYVPTATASAFAEYQDIHDVIFACRATQGAGTLNF